MTFRLQDLPYPKDALEPHMSAMTLAYHHGKHHAGYVEKLNDLIEGTDFEDLSLEEIVRSSAGNDTQADIFNNAAQVWNHNFFWECMTPSGDGEPDGELRRHIEADFGDFDTLQDSFFKAAIGQFGSGWAWLVMDAGKLRITTTPNAVSPLVNNQLPLLTCDVWEHAYYLDYQNDRERFVETFLNHLINWQFVNERFAVGRDGNPSKKRHDRETWSASG